MKVLLIDMHGGRSPDLGFQIKTTLQKLGHCVSVFDYRKYKLQHIPVFNRLLNKLMVQYVTQQKPELVLVNKGESILPGTIKQISDLGSITVNWNPDEPFGLLQPFNKISNVEEYSAFFTYDKKYVESLKKLNRNSHWLPPGADPRGVHKETIPFEEREFPNDLCLVGTAYPNRIQLMNSQLGKKLSIAGPGWDKAPNEISSKALSHVKITEMSTLFNKSKIVLNPYGASKHFIVPNPRTFEIPATRSFQLTDIPMDVSVFFRPKKEVVVYRDNSEFMELVEYYLNNDEEREKITQAGYKRVIKEHTMEHRVNELLKKI
jgi:spore maturation protein CgeB